MPDFSFLLEPLEMAERVERTRHFIVPPMELDEIEPLDTKLR